ncbi:uncharacterized protein FA14DRAFT_189669 [Meira miltonrushii]|uniref:Uncharacterized protein n=1 Tax=Meira miltonrushii TaxID=1280837 RepID=A0A316VF89_9BASI|nr:uncharacterized protein FA14DRAFT_189669 [Meira miltonrushii]PWN35728.1 hypothetical protein FA14DRAFT_189669 [Meira miltonrushii]
MRSFSVIFLVLLCIALTKAELTPKPRPRSTNELVSLPTFGKRDDADAKNKNSTKNNFVWPAIDGYQDQNPPDNMLGVGYLTYSTAWIKKTFEISDKDPEKADKRFFHGLLRGAYLWRDSCWKLTNDSAKAAQRTNTLARVVVYTFNDPDFDIDPIYHLSSTMALACWERDKDGDYNTPVVNHTETLMNNLHWDKASALKVLEKQHIYFGYTNKTSTHGHPKPNIAMSHTESRSFIAQNYLSKHLNNGLIIRFAIVIVNDCPNAPWKEDEAMEHFARLLICLNHVYKGVYDCRSDCTLTWNILADGITACQDELTLWRFLRPPRVSWNSMTKEDQDEFIFAMVYQAIEMGMPIELGNMACTVDVTNLVRGFKYNNQAQAAVFQSNDVIRSFVHKYSDFGSGTVMVSTGTAENPNLRLGSSIIKTMSRNLALYNATQIGIQVRVSQEDAEIKMMDDEVIRRAEELMRYQKFRPYLVNEKLHNLATILLRLVLVFRPDNEILTFNMLVIGLDTCAPELYCGIFERENRIQSDAARLSLKYNIIADLLTAAVLDTQRMPICSNYSG